MDRQDKQEDKQRDRQMDGQMGGQMGGQMDGQAGGQMGGQMKKEPEPPAGKIIVQSFLIEELSAGQKESLVRSFFALARLSLKGMTEAYIRERMLKYKIITLIQEDLKARAAAGSEAAAAAGAAGGAGIEAGLAGFSFSNVYFFRFLYFMRLPVFHCGLIVLRRDWRGRGFSAAVPASLYQLVLEKKMLSRFLMIFFGLLFTAKCSSPVSFLKIRKFARGFSWPKIKDEDSLSWLSRAGWSKALSRFLSARLSGQISGDFILRGVNKNSGYQPDEEEYAFHSEKDKAAAGFFKKRIMPESELITAAWFHPLWLYFQRKSWTAGKASFAGAAGGAFFQERKPEGLCPRRQKPEIPAAAKKA